jgi:RNA polymerase sigma-70 factor (ECF subfamily)
MSGALTSQTSPTLLGRLRQASCDQEAWREFVGRYAPRIYDWCRGWGLQEADAQDVTQDVLVKLAAKMRDFAYDHSRSFRGWLKTLVRHAWYDFARRWGRDRGSGGSEVLERLQAVEARENLVLRLQEEFDREVLEEAMARVRLRVDPHTWEAFRLLALEGWTGARAAAHLGMKVAAVFMARSNVQKRLREEVARLDGPGEEDGP